MGKLRRDDESQVRCWTGDDGHIWIHTYDTLPARVRQRLRSSPFNLCPACLESFFLPEVHARHRGLSPEQALFVAIEVMESEVRKRERR
jgi:hypothetical protein